MNHLPLLSSHPGRSCLGHPRLKIRTGQIYVVQLPDGSVTVKRLSLSVAPEEARLICHSDNVGVYKMFDFNLDPGRAIHSYVLGRVRWAGKEFD